MHINSEEVVNFIGKNFDALVRKHGYLGKTKVEDALNTLAMYLIARPRHIPDPEGWIAVSVKRKVFRNNDKDSRFLYENVEESLVDTINNFKDETDHYELIEEVDYLNSLRKKLNILINSELTLGQKDAVLNFIQNENHNSCAVNRNQFIKARRRLIDVVKDPRKSNTFKNRMKKYSSVPEKKRRSNGRYAKVSQEVRDAIIANLKIHSRGYNISELAKQFNVSKQFIKKELKLRNMNMKALKNV